jgi:hypothetical protein
MMARQLFSTNPTLNGHSPPFAHPDATYPERKLRIKLQEFCREKNAAIGNFGGERRYNSYFSNDQRFRPTSERYTHDGIKLYKVWAKIT